MNKKDRGPGNARALCLGFALTMILVPVASHAASVGLGASIWCAWWESAAASQASMFGGSSGGEPDPAVAGGPFLSVQFNDTWGMNLSYLYGRFKWDQSSPFIGISMDTGRHDLDLSVSAAVHKYVRLFFGAKYWGYKADISTKLLFLSYGSEVSRHNGGPGLGLGLSLPLGAGFYILPNISGVITFGKLSTSSGGLIGRFIGTFMSVEETVMYYGLNSTLSLAYNIEKANLTLALGGRLQYLWIYFIESERLVDQNDMFAGITFSAMYTFNIPGSAGKK